MGISQRIAALAAVATLSGAMASCSGAGLTPGDQGQAGQAPARQGPAVTLHVAVYGAPGYRQAGLFAAFEQQHPAADEQRRGRVADGGQTRTAGGSAGRAVEGGRRANADGARQGAARQRTPRPRPGNRRMKRSHGTHERGK